MEEYLSIGKAAKILGVTPKTLRRWEAAKTIRSERTPTGYRRYRADDVMRLLTRHHVGFGTRCVVYARVSSAKQSHDGNLDRQRDRLLEEAQKRGYDPVLVVAEQASGINDKRRGLWRVLQLAEKRGFDVLLIEFPDRLARFGYRYLTEYLRAFDVRVETVQDMPPASFEEELTRDLITILTVFSARLYGRRSRGFRKKSQVPFKSIMRKEVNKPLAKAVKTLILPLLDANTGKREALAATESLFTKMVRFYLDILLTNPSCWDKVMKVNTKTGEILSERSPDNKHILTRLEFATTSTPAHPTPTHPLSILPGGEDAPTEFRRAAINRAIGMAKSYRSNRKRWESLPTSRRGKPPAIPAVRSMPVTLYKGMALLVREETRSFLSVKVWNGEEWRLEEYPVAIAPYQRALLSVAEAEQARLDEVRAEVRTLRKAGREEAANTLLATAGQQQEGIPVMESGTLFHDGKRWRFHVPLATPIQVKRAKDQLAENPDLPVTTVDVGENNLAVAVAFDGAKVKGTLFIPGRQHEQRRFRRLKAIAVRQRKTGCRPKRGSNQRIWRSVRDGEEDVAKQTARRIVDLAKAHGSKVIVFEALGRMHNPKRTGWMKRQNLRQSYWMRGKIMRWVRHMALHEGILTVTRDAQFTSQACPRCGHLGARFCEAAHHRRRGKDVFRCYACGWSGNADLVGALNLRKKWLRIFPSIAKLRHEQELREAQGKRTNRRQSKKVATTKTGPNRRMAAPSCGFHRNREVG